MRRAIELARADGGKLVLHGHKLGHTYWSCTGRTWELEREVRRRFPGRHRVFRHRTIQALVDRGLMLYTKWEREDFPSGAAIMVSVTAYGALMSTREGDEV